MVVSQWPPGTSTSQCSNPLTTSTVAMMSSSVSWSQNLRRSRRISTRQNNNMSISNKTILSWEIRQLIVVRSTKEQLSCSQSTLMTSSLRPPISWRITMICIWTWKESKLYRCHIWLKMTKWPWFWSFLSNYSHTLVLTTFRHRAQESHLVREAHLRRDTAFTVITIQLAPIKLCHLLNTSQTHTISTTLASHSSTVMKTSQSRTLYPQPSPQLLARLLK
jgi:hypothetical protein